MVVGRRAGYALAAEGARERIRLGGFGAFAPARDRTRAPSSGRRPRPGRPGRAATDAFELPVPRVASVDRLDAAGAPT